MRQNRALECKRVSKATATALIVAKISDNKVTSYSNLADIWSKVGDKSAFLRYVEESVKTNLAK